LADCNDIPSRKSLKCTVVACIGSIELVFIKEDAGQRDGSLDVPLEVVGVVYEVEGVAGVVAQTACHITWPLQDVHVETLTVQTVVCHICGVADIELGCIDEHWQLKTHRCDGIMQ